MPAFSHIMLFLFLIAAGFLDRFRRIRFPVIVCKEIIFRTVLRFFIFVLIFLIIFLVLIFVLDEVPSMLYS